MHIQPVDMKVNGSSGSLVSEKQAPGVWEIKGHKNQWIFLKIWLHEIILFTIIYHPEHKRQLSLNIRSQFQNQHQSLMCYEKQIRLQGCCYKKKLIVSPPHIIIITIALGALVMGQNLFGLDEKPAQMQVVFREGECWVHRDILGLIITLYIYF